MDEYNLSDLHTRVDGLERKISSMLAEADAPGKPMSNRERKDLRIILALIKEMIRDSRKVMAKKVAEAEEGEMPVRHSKQYLNTQCE